MSDPIPSTAADRGRHRRPRRRGAVAVASALTLVGTVAVGATLLTGSERSPASSRPPGCTTERTLRVAAAPELAPAVEAVAGSLTGQRCIRITVAPAAPADTAASVSRGEPLPDVWIPDSSVWADRAPGASDGAASPVPSIAHSPVVLAVPVQAARRLGPAPTYEQVARAASSAHPLVLHTEPPADSATAQAALVDLGATLGSDPIRRGMFAALLRAMDATATAGVGLAEEPGTSRRRVAARVTTERAVRAANAATGGRRTHVAVRPPAPGLSMDYPYLVLATDDRTRAVAGALLGALRGEPVRDELERLGFRTTGAPRPLTGADARTALQTLAVLELPTRALAVVDVSGSMARQVPGAAGATRMELARSAIRDGLEVLPDGTVAGLWRFSSNLTPSTDHEEVAPLTPLTRQSRRRLAGALEGLAVVPYGGTGLHSSVLAGVRYVRASYDPERVNSVVVLSDGRNEDAAAHNVTLDRLLEALREESDPDRPVRVITIAYGPDSDTRALRAISAATGGTLYTSRDPRDLPVIFREAIGSRLCGADC
jgi:Ca-activated chloride channel family protein